MALFILSIAIGVVWLIVLAPIVSGFSTRAERRIALKAQYQADQRLVGSIPRLRRQAERQRGDLRNFVVLAPTSAAASTVLQDRVQRTIENVGGEVRAIEDATGSDKFVRVRASSRMTLGQMTALLIRLQNEPPHLIVNALNVTADQAVISGHLETMEVSLEVSVPVVLAKSR